MPPQYEDPVYSTKIFKGYYFYILAYYDKSVWEETLNELGMPLAHLVPDDNWVSNKFATDFLEVLKKRTGEKDIALNVGLYATSPEIWNRYEYLMITSFVPPLLFYFFLAKEYERFNRLNSFKLETWRPGNCVYRVKPKPEHANEKTHPDICQNTIGMITATKSFFKIDKLTVVHDQCIHHGADSCVFTLKYKAFNYWKIRFQSLLILLGAGGLVFAGSQKILTQYFESSTVLGVLSFSLSILVGVTSTILARYFTLFEYVAHYYEQNSVKTRELFESHKKLDRRYQEANLLKDLSTKLSGVYDSKEVVQLCLDELDRRFKYGKSFVMTMANTKDKLITMETKGFGEGSGHLSQLHVTYPPKKDDPHLFANILDSGKAVLIRDIKAYKEKIKLENQALIDELSVNSMVVTPVQDREEKFGLLVIGNTGSDPLLSQDDLHLMENISQLLSLALRNSKNFEKEKGLRTLFQKYVPQPVLESLDVSGPEGKLEPKNIKLASLFFDLRGFTSQAENLPPEKVIDILNIYTDFVTKKVAKRGGIIDKFMGDGVIVFFPAIESSETEVAKLAMTSALEILADLDSLNSIYESKGFKPASLGIGLSWGLATVGNMGSDQKLNYTAVGDTVNLAARLQDLSKAYRTKTPSSQKGVLLLTAEAYAVAGLDIEYLDLQWVYVRGRVEPVNVFLIDFKTATQFLSTEVLAA